MYEIIGGEFSIDPIEYLRRDFRVGDDDTYTPADGGVLFSCGRAALAGILRSIGNAGHLWLPDYLCVSITTTAAEEHWTYSFYHIDSNTLLPEGNAFVNVQERDVVLFINYFGIIDTSDHVSELKKTKKDVIVIMDNVQAFFRERGLQDTDYVFTSFRKWLPVPDGAVAYAKSNLVVSFTGENQFAQYKFAGNVLKAFRQDVSDDIALGLIDQGETVLDSDYHCQCSNITRKILPGIDMDMVRVKRRRNARLLHEGLEASGIKHLWTEEAVPMFIPIFVDARNNLRKKLFENNIFCPVHWPFKNSEINGENELYSTELSLICDQRYGAADMNRILKVIENAL